MEQAIEITKNALLARLNQRAMRFAVDTYYKRASETNDRDRLMIVYADGSETEFKGLDKT